MTARIHSFRSSALMALLSVAVFMAPISEGYGQEQNNDIIQDSVKDITTVLVVGAGGAVLGLSTLSFTEEPKNHLRNILVGGALGVIVGVGIVAYNQANSSKSLLIESYKPADDQDFSTYARNDWHEKSFEARTANLQHAQFSYLLSF